MKYIYEKFIGKRIRLISKHENSLNLQTDLLGTIISVDESCAIYVNWDNETTTFLLPDIDRFEIIFDGEIL